MFLGQLQQFNLPSHLGCAGNHLTMDGHDLVALAREHGSPLFVFSEHRLDESAGGFLKAARQGHARASVFFASKACSNLHVLKVILGQGLISRVENTRLRGDMR